MAKYHINPKTGNPGPCKAGIERYIAEERAAKA